MSSRRPFHTAGRRAGGYTLLEVVIAVGILVVLGSGLATLLTQGISIWRRAENRGKVYDQARILLERMAEDLRSTVVDPGAGVGSPWVRFICDRDYRGRQRLRFVRTISAETSNEILRKGGQYLAVRTPAVFDGKYDRQEASDGSLGAPGGLMEVVYLGDPRVSQTYLWRGYRSPVGGMGSLLNESTLKDDVLERLAEKLETARKAEPPAGNPDEKEQERVQAAIEEARKDIELVMTDFSRRLTDGVLYLGFSFWGPTTNTWEPVAPLQSPGGRRKSGPLDHWDSTRAILDESPLESGEFTFKSRDGSLTDRSDDIFPERVEITLVLRDDNSESLYLLEQLSKATGSFSVSKPLSLPEDESERFILVGDEWMRMSGIDGSRVTVGKEGRGWRGSGAKGHSPGTRVDIGVTFRRVVEMPGSRKSRRAEERAPAPPVRRKDP